MIKKESRNKNLFINQWDQRNLFINQWYQRNKDLFVKQDHFGILTTQSNQILMRQVFGRFLPEIRRKSIRIKKIRIKKIRIQI